MYSYEECIQISEKQPGFQKVYASFEDSLHYYFLPAIALGSPFYCVNKITGSISIIPGTEFQK